MQVRFDAQASLDILKILEDHIEGRHNVFYAKLLDLKTNPTPVTIFKSFISNIYLIKLILIFCFDS